MRFKAAQALLAVLTAAATIAAGPVARAAAPSPFAELERSIHGLFSQERRARRGARKTAKIAPVPYPPERPSEFRRATPVTSPAQTAARQPEMKVTAAVPLPPVRPATSPAKEPPIPDAPDARAAGEAQPGPSACLLRLTAGIAVAQALPPITGPGECGAQDVVRLDAVILKDGRRVAVAPAATLRCPMAEAVALWVREDVTAAAATLASPPRTLVTAASYECRGRNRVLGAKLSEHGHANALDVRGLTLADGSLVAFPDRAVSQSLREKLRQTACGRFKTVLGPGSDGYHESHIHLDLRERHGGSSMCQWNIAAPAEVASVPLPPERPRKGTPTPE